MQLSSANTPDVGAPFTQMISMPKSTSASAVPRSASPRSTDESLWWSFALTDRRPGFIYLQQYVEVPVDAEEQTRSI
jgi:hypothetical protein